MKYCPEAAMKALALSETILRGGPIGINISRWMNRTTVFAVESSVALAIGHPVRFAISISTNLFPVSDCLNGPENSIENVSNNPVTEACRLAWYVGSLLEC